MMRSYYEFFSPVKIVAGQMALEHIPSELANLGAKRPMIITDQGIRINNLLKPVEEAFINADSRIITVFDDVPPDSSLLTVRAAAQQYRDHQCDAIIAIGGGSVIDTSKAVNLLVSEGGDDLKKYSGAHNLNRPLKPFLVVPTTAGTGSEATLVAVIYDTENSVKIPFTSYYLLPNIAFLDPRMTQSLPPHITAMTAMDAMTHAIEAYTSLAHNPISDVYATTAIKKISQNLLLVLENPENLEARLELSQAATMAGIAFSNAMVGLVHSLGHATGAVAHIPHGLAMSLFLPHVLEYNQDVSHERIGELLLYLAGAEIFSLTPAAQRAEKAIATLYHLREALYQFTKLPRTLKETTRVTREQFHEIAIRALDDGSIIFNPKEADLNDIKAILEKAWA